MIVLDTNVVSEVVRTHPEERVVAWVEALTGDVAITTVTLGELLAGIRRLPSGKRQTRLRDRVEAAIGPYRGTGALLTFDERAAEQYAEVHAAREAMGLPIHTADAQIAAICRSRGAVCATRNVKDFVETGIDVVNPWEQ